MPVRKNRQDLAQEAERLAQSFSYVRYGHVTYVPQHYLTGDESVTPPPEETVWIPLTKQDIQQRAQHQFNTLFETDQQLSSFEFMVAQCSRQVTGIIPSLLVRTSEGLRTLNGDGTLSPPTGEFIPNTLKVPLNPDPDAKQVVLETISRWLDSEEEAIAMLRHFATALSPHWSAVKYILLLGSGRNGKSLMMHMLQTIFGQENCSSVTRQDISDRSPGIIDLNGKLLNLVFDGMAVYLKDSGMEKSIIAGEAVGIRRLYSSEMTPVQTNALFIEGLNREPKTTDKSTALQARIMRFWFPNTYPQDQVFWDRMLAPDMTGALLSLMIDNYVQPHNAAVMLAPTETAMQLQLEHMYENSYALQFLKFLDESDPKGVDALIDEDFSRLVAQFQSWRLHENDLRSWSEPEVLNVFRPALLLDRRSRRVNGVPRKIRIITGFTKETRLFIDTMKGDAHAVVGD